MSDSIFEEVQYELNEDWLPYGYHEPLPQNQVHWPLSPWYSACVTTNKIEQCAYNIEVSRNRLDNIKLLCQFSKWATLYVKENISKNDILAILNNVNLLDNDIAYIKDILEYINKKIIWYDENDKEYINVGSLFSKIESLEKTAKAESIRYQKKIRLLKEYVFNGDDFKDLWIPKRLIKILIDKDINTFRKLIDININRLNPVWIWDKYRAILLKAKEKAKTIIDNQ